MRSAWILGIWLVPALACSHALDPRSVDRYSEILLSPESGRVYYVLVYGQNGTTYARDLLQPDTRGLAAVERQQNYLAQRSSQYLPGQTLEIDGRRIALRFFGGVSGMTIGHGGAEVNRAVLIYEFDYPDGMVRDATVAFRYEDVNFARLFAWKQIRVLGLQGVQVDGHQPYQDLVPYDYTRLDLAGFLPSTRSVEGKIVVPAQPIADVSPSVSYAPSLMEFGYAEPPRSDVRILGTVVLVGVLIAVLIGGIAVAVSRRRART